MTHVAGPAVSAALPGLAELHLFCGFYNSASQVIAVIGLNCTGTFFFIYAC